MRKFGMITLLSLLAVLALVLLWLAAQGISDAIALDQPAATRMLFIGNSFTGNNELDQLVVGLIGELGPEWDDTFTTRVAISGYKIVNHLADVENEAENPLLRQLLISGSETARDWDLIVLQEQSQILGFSRQSPETAESFAVVPRLHQYAAGTGATVMLLLTWGYADGDSHNAHLYPGYPTMQHQLTQGTNNLAAQLSAPGSPVFVVPAGRGYQLVYRDLVNNGQDPVTPNSLFRMLYAEDGRHPSLAGSYLAACIVVAAYTGQSVADINWQPRQLDREFAAYLRSVAERVVFGAEFPPQTYPWLSPG